jgi:carbon monoxide dehydrogenase subunit G
MPGLYAAEMRRRVRLPPAEVWAHLEDTAAYRRWWPWLQLLDASGGLTTGATWRAGIRAPLPYVVAFTLDLTTVDGASRSVEADVSGDVTGRATIDVAPDGNGEHATDLRMSWRLTPASSFLKLLDATARPVARWGHDTIMRRSVDAFVVAVEQTPPP